MARLEADRVHDLAIANAELNRKGIPAGIAIVVIMAVTVALLLRGGPVDDWIPIAATSLAAGFFSYVAPALSAKEQLKKHYEQKREALQEELEQMEETIQRLEAVD